MGALLEGAVPLVDPLADNLLLVNSFNEWHEDTQIEPAVGLATTEPLLLTGGMQYRGYGNLYLEILARYTRRTDQSSNSQANMQALESYISNPLPPAIQTRQSETEKGVDTARQRQFQPSLRPTSNPTQQPTLEPTADYEANWCA